MGIALINLKMDKEFKQLNTVKGTATKRIVLQRLGLKQEVVTAPKYVMVGGVPHIVINGVFKKMTPVKK
jgi:hypothetical protein